MLRSGRAQHVHIVLDHLPHRAGLAPRQALDIIGAQIKEPLANRTPERHHVVAVPGDAGHFQSEGYVDGALVRSLVNQDADYFLCGSPPFMQGLIAELQGAGIAASAIHFEMFSRAPRSTAQASTSQANAEPATITFARSGQSATWASSDPDDTLLAFAEAQGLEPAFSCRAGVCGTCACRVLEGEVHYISEIGRAHV